MIPLAELEEIIDRSGVAPRIEALLPTGVRRRQLRVRTLLAGMCLTDPGDSTAAGTQLVIWPCVAGDPGILWRVS